MSKPVVFFYKDETVVHYKEVDGTPSFESQSFGPLGEIMSLSFLSDSTFVLIGSSGSMVVDRSTEPPTVEYKWT